MDRNSWFEPKWRWLKRFCISGLVGAALLIFGAGLELAPLVGAGVLCLLPLLFWLFFVPILHWKDRYIGNRSNIWGAFLVFETSSWSKLIYWFVHVLPDWKQRNHYAGAL